MWWLPIHVTIRVKGKKEIAPVLVKGACPVAEESRSRGSMAIQLELAIQCLLQVTYLLLT